MRLTWPRHDLILEAGIYGRYRVGEHRRMNDNPPWKSLFFVEYHSSGFKILICEFIGTCISSMPISYHFALMLAYMYSLFGMLHVICRYPQSPCVSFLSVHQLHNRWVSAQQVLRCRQCQRVACTSRHRSYKPSRWRGLVP